MRCHCRNPECTIDYQSCRNVQSLFSSTAAFYDPEITSIGDPEPTYLPTDRITVVQDGPIKSDFYIEAPMVTAPPPRPDPSTDPGYTEDTFWEAYDKAIPLGHRFKQWVYWKITEWMERP